MEPLGYDIFRKADDGSPLWVDEAATLFEVNQKLALMAQSSPGRYFARDAITGRIVATAGEAE